MIWDGLDWAGLDWAGPGELFHFLFFSQLTRLHGYICIIEQRRTGGKGFATARIIKGKSRVLWVEKISVSDAIRRGRFASMKNFMI